MKTMRSPRLQSARKSASNLMEISLNERGSLRPDRLRKAKTRANLRREGRDGRDGRDSEKMKSTSRRATSPFRDDPFRKTPSQKTSLTKVKMKIRGGGGSDDDVYRTPIKTARITGHDTGSFAKRSARKFEKSPIQSQRQRRYSLTKNMNSKISQPLNGSLPPPKPTGYSSEETPITNLGPRTRRRSLSHLHSSSANRSRSPVPPVAVGINDLLRRRPLDRLDRPSINTEFDDSPSPFMMAPPRSPLRNEMTQISPRGKASTSSKKRATSPLPAPQTLRKMSSGGSLKYGTSGELIDVDSEGDSDFEREFSQNDFENDGFLSPHSQQFASPAESFFSKVKHAANDPEEDVLEMDHDRDRDRNRDRRAKDQRKRQSMPEPGDSDDDDEFDGGYCKVSMLGKFENLKIEKLMEFHSKSLWKMLFFDDLYFGQSPLGFDWKC